LSFHQAVFIGLWLSMCGYAYARGGQPERVVATLFILGALASLMFAPPKDRPFEAVEIGIMTVDSAMFLVLFALAMSSSRFWPLTMASLQGAEVVAHIARLSMSGIVPPTYFMVTVMWSFPMLLLLGVATWRHRWRLRRYGRDYAWSWQLPADYRSKGIEL
jgi:hypothetical protein